MKNALRRIAGTLITSGCLVAIAQAGPILLIEDQGGFGGAATVLTNDGFTVQVVNNEFANGFANLRDTVFLNGFDMVVYGERGGGVGGIMSVPVQQSLEAYVQQGGHLLVTGYDTLGSPTDHNLAALMRLNSPGDHVSYDPAWNVANLNHPILNGPFGSFQGLSFSARGYDDDRFTLGAGTIALATMNNQQVRVSLNDLPGAAGSVGYWNGGLAGMTSNAQPDFSSGDNTEDIFLNWGCWATSCQVVPEPSTLVLTAFGLALGAFTRRRR